jgi:hypothetical protein
VLQQDQLAFAISSIASRLYCTYFRKNSKSSFTKRIENEKPIYIYIKMLCSTKNSKISFINMFICLLDVRCVCPGETTVVVSCVCLSLSTML